MLRVMSDKSDWLGIPNDYSARAQKIVTFPEVPIPGAYQKERGLWGRECLFVCLFVQTTESQLKQIFNASVCRNIYNQMHISVVFTAFEVHGCGHMAFV